jgi:hypothetical protein
VLKLNQDVLIPCNSDYGPPNPDLDVFIIPRQLTYHSNKQLLLDGKWGLDVIIPLMSVILDYRLTVNILKILAKNEKTRYPVLNLVL